MGPRFCKRGNLPALLIERQPCPASMGPRFFKRGNVLIAHCDTAIKAGLQWGHAFVSVETACKRDAQHGERVASMGPRFCKRGNSGKMRPALLIRQLQWGHAFVSVETGADDPDVAGVGVASMGPRFCKRGNHLPRARCNHSRHSFNGATLL